MVRQLESELLREKLTCSDLRRQVEQLQTQLGERAEDLQKPDMSDWLLPERPRQPIKTLEQVLDVQATAEQVADLKAELSALQDQKDEAVEECSSLRNQLEELQAYLNSITSGPPHPFVANILASTSEDPSELVKDYSLTLLKLQAENKYLRIALDTEREARLQSSKELDMLRHREVQARTDVEGTRPVPHMGRSSTGPTTNVMPMAIGSMRNEFSYFAAQSSEGRQSLEGTLNMTREGRNDGQRQAGYVHPPKEEHRPKQSHITRRILEARDSTRPSLAFGMGTLGADLRLSEGEGSSSLLDRSYSAKGRPVDHHNTQTPQLGGPEGRPASFAKNPMKESFRATYLRSVSKSPTATAGRGQTTSGRMPGLQIAKTDSFLADFNRRLESLSGKQPDAN